MEIEKEEVNDPIIPYPPLDPDPVIKHPVGQSMFYYNDYLFIFKIILFQKTKFMI